jgi:hypothetical protein
MALPYVASLALAALLLSACSGGSDAEQRRAAEQRVASALPPEPASLPVDAAVPTQSGTPAQLPSDTSGFDVASVPVTTVALPPFPFFRDPEGLVNELQGPDAQKPFDRHWFIAGGRLVPVEGRLALARYNLESGRRYSTIEFHRNYENAVQTLGGRRISTTQFSDALLAAAGGREAVEKFWNAAPPVPDAEHHSYLVRTAHREYWIHVSAGGTVPLIGFVTVLEKQAMQSALGFLDAAAMKKALDDQGRVALYINFDVDRATLRPDAQPVIDEIGKLLASDPALRLSIEGHTDSTGSAERNRELAAARARTVLGALVGLGVDPARLRSSGFGPDRPIADNSTEEGRAKNRRVELVKIS